MALFKVYNGTNSPFTYLVTDVNGVKYSIAQMASITRVALKYTPNTTMVPEYADSSIHYGVFNTVKYATTGYIVIDLGMRYLTPGSDQAMEIIVYDATYPEGRILPSINISVSAEVVRDDQNEATELVIDMIEGRQLTVSDLNKALCIVSTDDEIFPLPEMSALENGFWLDIVRGGTGDVTLPCGLGNTIGDSTKTTLVLPGAITFTHTRIQYFHAITAWVVFRMGDINGI